MLCSACEEIFSKPRRLAYGSISPWRQTPESFRRALNDGCHLCNIIDENRSYNRQTSPEFPRNVNYAFKPLKPSWARYGKGNKWYAYQQQCSDDDPVFELLDFMAGVEKDPTPNGLGALLATDAPNLLEEAKNSWLVLEFLGNEHILLPMEICTNEPLERLAQSNLALQASTGQKETLCLAKTWLQNCQETHPSCQSRSDNWLPTRLIDVGTVDEPILRLVSSISLEPDAPYIALSHRWGAHQTFILRSRNVAAYHKTIPTADVSATVRDAARVTRALGVRYLWVDCMCIIQDDDGEDWARESDTMFKVYGLSTCTIAAANSGDGEEGFLTNRNQYRVRPCRIPSPFKTGSKHSFKVMSQYLNKIHDKNVRNSEWFNRGWVFQERMLAPRLLIFTKTQVLWGCAKLQAAETWPCGKTNDNHIDTFNSVEVEKNRLNVLVNPEHGISTSHQPWWGFLQDYMSSQLTVWSDRLAAIRGIAALVEDLTGEKYCGGMWLTDDLPNALLWRVRGEPLLRPRMYVAPSFSWAAVMGGGVEFGPSGGGGDERCFLAVNGSVQVNPNPRYGKTRNVQEGLQLLGFLLPCSILTSKSGVGVEEVMIRGEAVKWTEIIRIEIEEAERAAAWRKAVADAEEKLEAAKQREEAAGAIPPWDPLRKERAELEKKLKELQVMEPIKSPPRDPRGKVAQNMFVLPELRGGGDNTPSLKARIQRRTKHALSKLTRAAEATLKPAMTPEMRQHLAHKADMKRRQQAAEARAERVFADLARGVVFEDPLEVEKRKRKERPLTPIVMEYLDIRTNMDFLMPRREVLDVFLLPVIDESGLVVREVDEGRYERIGMFSQAAEVELRKLPWSKEPVEFLLV